MEFWELGEGIGACSVHSAPVAGIAVLLGRVRPLGKGEAKKSDLFVLQLQLMYLMFKIECACDGAITF